MLFLQASLYESLTFMLHSVGGK